MTFTDYLIDISLIALVLVQVRGRRITTRGLVLPVGIVTYVAFTYLKGIPTAGNDLVLVLGCAAVGALLGGLAGRFTTVRPDAEGIPVAKAGLAAAVLWILGTGGRLAFQVYATHGGGAADRPVQHGPQHHQRRGLDRRPDPHGPLRGRDAYRDPGLEGVRGPPETPVAAAEHPPPFPRCAARRQPVLSGWAVHHGGQ